MHILFDQNVPRAIRRTLPGHLVETSEHRGWAQIRNGTLIAMAEGAGFEVFITADQNLEYQQNLQGRKIALVVLGSGQWPIVKQHLLEIAAAVNSSSERSYRYVRMQMAPRPARTAGKEFLYGKAKE